MKIKETKKIKPPKINFPFALYFKQLFAANIYVKFINPFGFWLRYRINHLEKCREIDITRYLENCYQLELPSKELHNNEFITKQNVYGTDLSKNQILISQPSVKLKYRGVAYPTSKVVAVNVNQVICQDNLSTCGSSEREFCILERWDCSEISG